MARYDWTPFFSAINGAIDDYSERQQYAGLLGGGASGGAPSSGLLSGVPPEQLAMLRRLPPKVGMKMLGEMMKPDEYGTTPQYNADGSGFVLSKSGKMKSLDGVKAREKLDNINGVAVNMYQQQPGSVLPQDVTQPFMRGQDGSAMANRPVQNYQMGLRQAGRSVTNVNNNMGQNGIDYGKPSDGLTWKRDASGKVVLDERGAPIGIPYQGGKAYLEAQQKDAAKTNADAAKRITSDVVVTDINRALEKVGRGRSTGWVGSKLQDVAGTDASDVKSLVTGIKANLAFDKLQAMRAASPTGGALGNVSEGELKLLESAVGSLEQSQSQEQFEFNANRVKDLYIDTVHGPGASKRMRAQRAPAGQKPQAPSVPDDVNQVLKQYGL